MKYFGSRRFLEFPRRFKNNSFFDKSKNLNNLSVGIVNNYLQSKVCVF